MSAARVSLFCAIAALVTVFAGASQAEAATVKAIPTYLGTVIQYKAEPGEVNGVIATKSTPTTLRLAEYGTGTPLADIDGAGGCVVTPGPVPFANCPGSNVDRIEFDLGDGNDIGLADTATIISRTVLNGGPGHDILVGGQKGDSISGGPGNDNMVGQGGDDTLVGGLEYDVYNGGEGNDSADFSDHTAGVNVSLDGTANDGNTSDDDASVAGDQRENVSGQLGIENVRGTSADDTINGDTGPNKLLSGDGRDFVFGNSGDDLLLDGNAGPGPFGGMDLLNGDRGDDVIYGGPGDDQYHGSNGQDIMSEPVPLLGTQGGGIYNVFLLAEGYYGEPPVHDKDVVACGPGWDRIDNLDYYDDLDEAGGACDELQNSQF